MMLAAQAGHQIISNLVETTEVYRNSNPIAKPEEIFGTSFENLVAVVTYYGSRWAKLYDPGADTVYYFDRVSGSSQWERPPTYDLSTKAEGVLDTARECLRKFYLQFNPNKLHSMNDILHIYKGNYTDLFVQLAERYKLDDLSIFQGIYLEDE